MKHLKFLISVISAFLIVYGCGGGGGGSKAPKISLSKSSLDFAGVVLNNSADQTIEIVNTGHKNLNIGQIVSNLPFSIVTDTCTNVTLAPSPEHVRCGFVFLQQFKGHPTKHYQFHPMIRIRVQRISV